MSTLVGPAYAKQDYAGFIRRTVALALDWVFGTSGVALFAFYAIIAWQVASLAWHAQRVVAFWGQKLR